MTRAGRPAASRSRYHLFRRHRAEAARTAAQMRDDLLAARAQDADDAAVQFGLGLSDYYGDVLPRLQRLLRFLSRLPGGDRARGLEPIGDAARAATRPGVEERVRLHDTPPFYDE